MRKNSGVINTMMPNDDVPEAPIILAITVPPREIRTANTRVGRTDFWYAIVAVTLKGG